MKTQQSRPAIIVPPRADQRACVLIVDGDKVSQRAIELALAPTKYAIEWARDGEAAFEIMRRVRVDVVIADSLLSDMPGITLVRRTLELCGPGAPTFLFVSADRANTTKIGLLMVGATDYLVKPFNSDELRVRVQNVIKSRQLARSENVHGVTGLAGDASQVPIPDILTMLELTRKTGVLHVSVGPATGRIVIEEGRLSHAEVGNITGENAFFVLVQYNGGVYRFEPGHVDAPHTIHLRVSEMLLESAIREDSARSEKMEGPLESTITSTSASLRELGIVKSSIDLRSRTSTSDHKPQPVGGTTARLAVAVADPYLLGDLVLAPEIPVDGSVQFRIELWAALAEGVAAFLSLASSPGFQVLSAALEHEDNQRLHLQFETQNASIIITLIDLDQSSGLPPQVPNGIVLVPPRGELVSLDPQRLAELTGRIDLPNRPVVVALGGTALQSTLARMIDDAFRYIAMPSRLEDPRDVIGGVMRLWAASR
jgi:CheY-like chemotaxis protein